ncbi:putative NOT transcription complex subunit VIP2-like isoform 1 [Capsicum annuum]|nr:putative NOT transcription complex subunit VIP2-like isoform 1 [Capsicum annuum]KAF3680011.1 putative NOT transcription complex subunit VIP2-like isoform 1 [Capsicum annuum]
MERSMPPKRINKQLIGKREDIGLHKLDRNRNVAEIKGIIDNTREEELAKLLVNQNSAGDIPLYVSAEYSYYVVKVLILVPPELSMTIDASNTTTLHSAANQGHIQVLNYLLEAKNSLATIAISNRKTTFHSAARNRHVQVVKALLNKEEGIASRMDKKGETTLHMAVKGENLKVV